MQNFECQNHVRAVLRVDAQLFVCATGVDAPIVYYLDVSITILTQLKQFIVYCLWAEALSYAFV